MLTQLKITAKRWAEIVADITTLDVVSTHAHRYVADCAVSWVFLLVATRVDCRAGARH